MNNEWQSYWTLVHTHQTQTNNTKIHTQIFCSAFIVCSIFNGRLLHLGKFILWKQQRYSLKKKLFKWCLNVGHFHTRFAIEMFFFWVWFFSEDFCCCFIYIGDWLYCRHIVYTRSAICLYLRDGSARSFSHRKRVHCFVYWVKYGC